MSIRLKKVILVAPEIFPEQLTTGFMKVKHVSAVINIFPAIFEITPDLIIFDHEFMGKDMEKTLRRIQSNKFYNKIKISCYKNSANTKADDLLKVLGVDHFIYREDLAKQQKSKSVFNAVQSIIDTSIINLVTSVSN
jgi:hypothetical protein